MAEAFDTWCIVELMGHFRTGGRVTEEQRFGSVMGRVDVPTPTPCAGCQGTRKCAKCGGMTLLEGPCPACQGRGDCPGCGGDGSVEGFTTIYFGGSSVFRVTPCSEQVARGVAASRPPPVHRLALPAAPRPRDDDDYDPRDDDDE